MLYYKAGKKLPAGLMDEVHEAVATLEKELGKKFGDDDNPLLFSVRSGAACQYAGDDEHDSEPRPERCRRPKGWPTRPRTSGSLTTPTAA